MDPEDKLDMVIYVSSLALYVALLLAAHFRLVTP